MTRFEICFISFLKFFFSCDENFLKNEFIVVLGLRCVVGLSLAAASGGSSLAVVRGFLFAVASLVAEHGLQGVQASVVTVRGPSSFSSGALGCRFSSCSAWA